jgi:ChaB
MTGGVILATFVEEPMPYPTNADLPPSVRSHLPEHAQEIYREAFNHAFAAQCRRGSARGGGASNRVGGRQAFLRQGREQSWIARHP